MQQVFKDTTYSDSADAHAARYEAAWRQFERELTTMTAKEVVSAYFTEAREVIPDLIRRWGKTVAYVNEQVQEHVVKLIKQLYHTASNHRNDLSSYLRKLASGETIEVTPRSTCHAQMLRRLVDWHWAMDAVTDNRTVQRKASSHGAAAWEGKAELPTHQLMAELEASLEGILRDDAA